MGLKPGGEGRFRNWSLLPWNLSLPASDALCNFPVSLDDCELNPDERFSILWSRYVLKRSKTSSVADSLGFFEISGLEGISNTMKQTRKLQAPSSSVVLDEYINLFTPYIHSNWSLERLHVLAQDVLA